MNQLVEILCCTRSEIKTILMNLSFESSQGKNFFKRQEKSYAEAGTVTSLNTACNVTTSYYLLLKKTQENILARFNEQHCETSDANLETS